MDPLAATDAGVVERPGTTTPGPIEYHERGDGPALVFVPGSFSTGTAWRSVVLALRQRWRIVTTSLLGYGETAERRAASVHAMDAEIAVVETVLRRAGRDAPVHLVGHSFGAQVALATAIRGRVPLASLCLIEPPCPAMLRLVGDHERFADFRAMTGRYFDAFAARDREAARHVIDFYGGAGTFDALAPRVRDFVIETTPTNVLDWRLAYADQPSARDVAAVTAPTLVLRGGRGHAAVRRSNELIACWLPQARLVDVPGAGHFMIATHPATVSALIEAHATAACERTGRADRRAPAARDRGTSLTPRCPCAAAGSGRGSPRAGSR